MERQGLEPAKRVAYFEYDFAKDGGAVGEITLRGDALPEGAIVHDGMIHVHTAVTSGGAPTVALHLLNAQDVLAETLKATLALAAVLATVPVGTAATAILNTTANNKLKMVIGVAALTAGKFVVALEYYA
jgi:hypothetical protein